MEERKACVLLTQGGIAVSGRQMTAQNYIREYTGRYMEKIFYFSLKKTGNQQEAEDLASDISLCIFAQLQKGVIPAHFSAWVWQIARNRYSRWAEVKHKKAESFAGIDIGECEIPGGETAEESYIKSEEIALLRRELAFISSDYRNVLIPYYIEDRPIRDIAKKLGLTTEAVKKRLTRARKTLKGGMDMAREFGIKSYNPEEVGFCSSGEQPSGLPWSAVDRKIPKNILLQANNNPSTIEELSIELGIAAPYMEEEVGRLVKATLLKKLGDKKYVTNFFIEDSECQLKIFTAQRKCSKERSELADKIAEDLLPKMRELGIAGDHISDADVKWWLVIYIVDFCTKRLDGYEMEWPDQRENGETWGFVGYEAVKLPKQCNMGCNGKDNENALFLTYKICGYDGMWDRVGEMSSQEAMLLGDILRNKRNLSSLSESEVLIWKCKSRGIEGRFAHESEDGTVVPDILVFTGKALCEVKEAIAGHPAFEALLRNIQSAFDSTVDILKENNIDVLRTQLHYCASMDMRYIRMMTVHDEVESGRLSVPEDPSRSTAAMWLELK